MYDGNEVHEPTHVRVGTIRSYQGEYIEVESVSNHPNYTRGEYWHDISILQLKAAASVPPGTFNRNTAYPSGTEIVPVTAYGFGGTNTDHNPSMFLRKADTTILTDAACTVANGIEYYSPTMHVCTQIETEGICGGDSGGPILDSSGIVMGILSFGSDYCGTDTNDVWVDPAPYAAWIDEQTGVITASTPSVAPSSAPSDAPSDTPSLVPSLVPRLVPSLAPSVIPTSTVVEEETSCGLDFCLTRNTIDFLFGVFDSIRGSFVSFWSDE